MFLKQFPNQKSCLGVFRRREQGLSHKLLRPLAFFTALVYSVCRYISLVFFTIEVSRIVWMFGCKMVPCALEFYASINRVSRGVAQLAR